MTSASLMMSAALLSLLLFRLLPPLLLWLCHVKLLQ